MKKRIFYHYKNVPSSLWNTFIPNTMKFENSDYKMTNEESEHINDLWEDMDRLNALYEELMWDNDDVLEFVADYKNDRIIIKNRSRENEIE